MTRPSPPCPYCGSSDTLPFEKDDTSSDGQSVTEVALGALAFFLSLLAILLFFLLSRASLPAAVLLAMALLLFWRRRREMRQKQENRPHAYVCLDCNRSFRA